MKKILVIAVALVLAMALTVSVFAAPPAGVSFTTSSGDNTLRIGDTLTVTFDGTVAKEFCLKAMYDADGSTNYCNLVIFGGAYKDWNFDGTEATKYFSAYGVNDADVARLGFTAELTEVDGGASTLVFTVTEAPVAKFSFYGDVGNVGDSYGWDDFNVVNEPSTTAPAPAEPDTTPEPDATPEPDTTPEPDAPVADKTETPAPSAPKTGLALAVVPAVMALAAVAVSKKH